MWVRGKRVEGEGEMFNFELLEGWADFCNHAEARRGIKNLILEGWPELSLWEGCLIQLSDGNRGLIPRNRSGVSLRGLVLPMGRTEK
jgi:hypothetical protein